MGKRIGVLVVTMAVMALVVGGACAQPDVETHWMANLRLGYSHADVFSGESLMKGDSRRGMSALLSTELVLNETFGWEFGVGFVQKGAKGRLNSSAALDPDSPDQELDFVGTMKLGYVTLDMLFNAFMPVGYNGKLRACGGIGLGFLVNAQAEGTLNDRPAEIDLDRLLKGQDFFGIVGVGYTYTFNNDIALMLDFRSEIGFVSIDDSNLDSGLKNISYQGLVGVGIPILAGD